jgi:hypothetical protein
MRKYETVLRIINYGEDAFDAGEKAGNVINMTGYGEEILISCEPTREADIETKCGRHFFRFASSQLVESVYR